MDVQDVPVTRAKPLSSSIVLLAFSAPGNGAKTALVVTTLSLLWRI